MDSRWILHNYRGDPARTNDFMLNVKTIRERLSEAPFTPFRICLSDGRRILAKHPDFVAIGGSVVFVADEDDHLQRLDSLHIVSLDDVRTRKHNGKH